MEENKSIPPEQPQQNIPEGKNSATENILPEAATAATEQPQTSNLKTETSNMEVHHPHHVTHKKKWTEYLLEFFMLFLAVFLGFLAENQREHYIENQREKVYVKNLYEDLKSDTVSCLIFAKTNEEFSNSVDTLITLMKSPDRDLHFSKIYFLARTATMMQGITLFLVFNQRTFTQMKNSGQLRLISNQQVADSISSYYNSLEVVQLQNESIVNRTTDYMRIMGELFDAEVLFKIWKERKEPPSQNLRLLTTDPIIVNKYLTALQYFYGTRNSQNILAQEQSKKAKILFN